MGVSRLVVAALALASLVSGLALAGTGVVVPATDPITAEGVLLVLVGLTLVTSLWLTGWGRQSATTHE